MNRGYYSKLLGQYRAFFEQHYDEDRPFSATLLLKERESQNRKFKVKGAMITENERNELGDVASVNSDNSVVQIAQKEDNKSRYKFKLRENRISGLFAMVPEQASSGDFKQYFHEFGVESEFEPNMLWNFCGYDKWNLFINAKYNDVCFNQLKVGYEGTTNADNKVDALKPNKAHFNNATIFENGFFLGGSIDFSISDQKPESFEKLVGYGNKDKLIFAKHTSKGFANEEGQVEAGAFTIVDNLNSQDEMGVGVNYKIESKESVVTAGFGRYFNSSKMHLKAKAENTVVTGIASVGLTERLRVVVSESIDVVPYLKNPKDGDSHKYKMGVSLIYTDLF